MISSRSLDLHSSVSYSMLGVAEGEGKGGGGGVLVIIANVI